MSDLKDADGLYINKTGGRSGTVLFNYQQALHLKNGTVYCSLFGNGQVGLPLSMRETVILIVENFLNYCRCLSGDNADKIKWIKIIVYTKHVLDIGMIWQKFKNRYAH